MKKIKDKQIEEIVKMLGQIKESFVTVQKSMNEKDVDKLLPFFAISLKTSIDVIEEYIQQMKRIGGK